MAMDSNFERLEQEVNRLVEVLNNLREENTDLKGQIQGFEEQAQQARGEIGRLQQVESEFKDANQTRDEVRGRVESLLTRLDGLEL
ncbi:MAG: chromosome segregation ATPase [Candidatus Latescibacterota bacterium]|jgi:chromosome segregation ATPase